MIASLSTDYREPAADRFARLRSIAEAGFTCIHWCWNWNDDYAYSADEIRQATRWLSDLKLQMGDVHGSWGKQKRWVAADESVRRAGVELVRNRIELAAACGARAVVMHLEEEAGKELGGPSYFDRLRRSIDALRPDLRRHGIRIALENLTAPGQVAMLDQVFAQYSPDEIGLCFDSGHSNITGTGLPLLARHRQRLAALHLHDNDGKDDQHRPPFIGTVDWATVTSLIADSPYPGPLTLELIAFKSEPKDAGFLVSAHEAAGKLIAQIHAVRGG